MNGMMNSKLPICVDLDGTLLRTDVLSEALVIYLRQYPWRLFHLLAWFLKGRAYLKEKVASVVDLDISALPVNGQIVNLIQHYKAHGHQILLVTAAPYKYGVAAAAHFNLFDDVMTSDKGCNLRSYEKAKALVKRFGENQFCYMGNSGHDLPVWGHAGEIVAINAPFWVLKKIWTFSKPYTILEEGLLPSRELLKLILRRLSKAEFLALAPLMLFMGTFVEAICWHHPFSIHVLLLKTTIMSLSFIMIRIAIALHSLFKIRQDQKLSKQLNIEQVKAFDNLLSQALAHGQIPLGFIVQLALVCLTSIMILSGWLGFK